MVYQLKGEEICFFVCKVNLERMKLVFIVCDEVMGKMKMWINL